jgi:hypothetical protein
VSGTFFHQRSLLTEESNHSIVTDRTADSLNAFRLPWRFKTSIKIIYIAKNFGKIALEILIP